MYFFSCTVVIIDKENLKTINQISRQVLYWENISPDLSEKHASTNNCISFLKTPKTNNPLQFPAQI